MGWETAPPCGERKAVRVRLTKQIGQKFIELPKEITFLKTTREHTEPPSGLFLAPIFKRTGFAPGKSLVDTNRPPQNKWRQEISPQLSAKLDVRPVKTALNIQVTSRALTCAQKVFTRAP